MNRIEIFKPGSFVAMNGKRYEYTEADLRATAAVYDPDKHEAPMVIGHPKDDAPAYGWGKALEFADGGLQLIPDQVDPAFAELHRAGRFKKRSASFYAPDDPRNPTPGTWYLRHVGFLGAQPPAVKGLKAANFGEGDAVTVEFGDWNDQTIARLFRNVKNFLIEKFGKTEADQVIGEWELEDITREALRPEPIKQPIEPEFTEPPTKETPMKLTQEQLDQREKDLEGREASFAEREKTLKQQESAARRQKNIAFADNLVGAGKLLPQHKEFVVDFMEALESAEGEVAFSEGKKVAPREAFCQFLEDLGGHPLFKQMTKPAEDDPEKGAAFSENLTSHV